MNRILLELLIALAPLTLAVGVVKVSLMFRARAMQTVASKWGFQYIGPTAFRWGFLSMPKIRPPLPASLSLDWYPSNEIRQVWNVIEGRQNGVSVLIFDGFFGTRTWCTFIAWQTEQNPFGRNTATNRVIQSNGWTVLYRIPVLQTPWATWTMGIRHLEDTLNKLRVGSVG